MIREKLLDFTIKLLQKSAKAAEVAIDETQAPTAPPQLTSERMMRDDLSRIKTICRRRMMGEVTEWELLREVNRLAMKHAHGHYPEEE